MGGKKASGKHYTSKGERKSSISTRNTDPGQRLLNQLRALNEGKNVNITLPFTSQFQNKDGKPITIMVKTKVNGKEWLKKRMGPSEKVSAE